MGRDRPRITHVDGELVPADEATVSVRDRGFRYGDAAFETLRAYGETVFEWAAHERRLRATCETLGMADAVPDDLRERVRETLAANDLVDAYVRLSVTRGVQPGKLTPDPDVEPTVVVIVEPLPRGGVDGEPVWADDGPATLRTVDVQRISDAALPAGAKTHNYLNGILARLALRDAAGGSEGAADGPATEALLRDAEGYVAEGATSNVFFVEGGTLHTPSLEGPVLPGVTRGVVLELARDAGIPAETGRYGPPRLRDADELFLTNTTWEVRPVGRLDGVAFEGGPVTERLAAAFDERVEELYRDARS